MTILGINIFNKINTKSSKLFNIIIDICIALYFLSTLFFGEDIKTLLYCKIFALFCVSIIIIYYLLKKDITLRKDNFINLFVFFILYCFISSYWAYDFEKSWEKSFSLLQNFFILFFIYNYTLKTNKVKYIINLLALSGFIYSIYIFTYYGFIEYITLFALGQSRIGGEITNVNFIGLSCLFSNIVITWKIIFKKEYLYIIPFLSCSIIAIGSGSKKILLGGLLAFIFLFFLKSKSKNIIRNVFIFIFIITLLIPLTFNLPFVHKIVRRTEVFFNAFGKNGVTDYSTQARIKMIKIGWSEFKSNPVLGIGIGNSNYVLRKTYGSDTYFHNNFIEIFASLGMLGGIIYYLFFLYPVFLLFCRNYKLCDEYILCLILVFVRFFLHIGMVDYYVKSSFLYILLSYLIVNDRLIFNEYQKKLISYEE